MSTQTHADKTEILHPFLPLCLSYVFTKEIEKKKKKRSHIQGEKQIHDDNSTFPTWLKIDLQQKQLKEIENFKFSFERQKQL